MKKEESLNKIARHIGALCLWLCLVVLAYTQSACPSAPTTPDGGEKDDPPVYSEQAIPLSLDPAAPALPFPSDFLAKDDPASPTSLRIALNDKKNSRLIDEGLLLFGDLYPKLLSQLDGWSAAGSFVISLTGEIRTDNLPGDPAAALASQAPPAILLDVDPTSPEKGQRIPLLVHYKNLPDSAKSPQHLLHLRPLYVLQPRRRYLIALTSALQDKEGKPLAPSETFRYLRGEIDPPNDHPARAQIERERLRLLEPLALLAQQGIPRNELGLAFLVTTGSTMHDLIAADEIAAADPRLQTPKIDLARKEDGKLKIYEKITDVPHAPQGTRSEGVLATLAGHYDAPNFRNQDGEWIDKDGKPALQEITKISFLLVLPEALRQEAVPLVVIQHGLNSYKENMLKMASAFAKRGVAALMIDAVSHGDRAVNRMQGGLEFLAFTSGLRFLDNFRQSVIDHSHLSRMLDHFAKLDLYPFNQPDGKPDLQITRRAYIGHSLGGIFGGVLLSLQPQTAAVIAASGGRFEDLMVGILGSRLPAGNELLTLKVSLVLQQFLNRADPMNAAAWWKTRDPQSWKARQILMQQANRDEVMPAAATWSQAFAFELPQIRPSFLALPGLLEASSPQLERGITQFPEALHNYILDEAYPPETLQAQEQAAHFLTTFLKTGKGEIKAP